MKHLAVILLLSFLVGCSDLLVGQKIPQVTETSNININPDNETDGESFRLNCGRNINDRNPIFFIVDGKQWTQEKLSELDVESIQSIEVFKNTDKWKRYNLPQNTSGVVAITTKWKR